MNSIFKNFSFKRKISSLLPKGSLSRNATLVVIGDAINFATGIITSMILARLIPVTVMGTYRQIIYLGPLVASIAEFGFSNSVYRYWNTFDSERRAIYIKMIVTLSVILGIIASGILALSADLISNLYNNPLLKDSLLICSLFPLATLPLMLLRPVLICRGHPISATLIETSFSILSIGGLIIPILLGQNFLNALAIWMVVILARLIAVPLVLNRDLFIPGKIWDKAVLSQVWKYEYPIQIGRIPGYITGYLDKIVMSLFLSPTDFAIYSLGAREIPFIGNIGPSIANVLVPNLVLDVQSNNFEQINRRWRLACERTAFFTYPIGAFCIWFAVPIMQFLFSVQYTESSVPFRIFSAITFLRVIEYASMAKAFGRSDLIMKFSFINALTLILLAIPLTYFFKSAGMASAVFISTFTGAIFYLYQFRNLLKTNLSSFYPWKRLILLCSFSFFGTLLSAWLLEPLLKLSIDTSIIVLGWKLIVLFMTTLAIYMGLLSITKLIGSTRLFRNTLLSNALDWIQK